MKKNLINPALSQFFIILAIWLIPSTTGQTDDKKEELTSGRICLAIKNYVLLYDLFSGDTAKIKACLDTKEEGANRVVFITLEKQELFLVELADTFQVLLQTKISSGLKPGWTPTGCFTISKKRLARKSKKYGGVMTYWNCLTPNEAIAIHGLRDKSYEKNLGRPVSHGCIRIGKDIEEKFYELTPVGTKVLIE